MQCLRFCEAVSEYIQENKRHQNNSAVNGNYERQIVSSLCSFRKIVSISKMRYLADVRQAEQSTTQHETDRMIPKGDFDRPGRYADIFDSYAGQ